MKDMRTIPEQFFETAQRFSKRPALKFKYHGAYLTVTFSELKKRTEELAAGLASIGVQKGDRVGIFSENRTEWVRMDLASLTLGAITVPFHTTLSPYIIGHIIADAGVSVIFVSTEALWNKLLLAREHLIGVKKIIYLAPPRVDHQLSQELFSLDEVMRRGQQAGGVPTIAASLDDPASIVYTSGTTAMPKGVVLTHRNFIFDAEASVTAVPVDEHDVLLSFMPLSHVLERTTGYYAPLVCRGCCIAYAESVATLRDNMREIKPTIIISVPRIFEKIHDGIWDKVKKGSAVKRALFRWALKQHAGTITHAVADYVVFKKIRGAFGGRLRLTISGGATLNHKLARFFARIGVVIVEGYGLTETSPVITCNRPGTIKFGTVGRALDGVEIKVAPDKEILTRGPHIMTGYYNKEALTREVIDSDGWFHTGDLGFLTSEQYLVIIGRKKEMLALSNGKIAWPEAIEAFINDDRLISQAFVCGNKKSYLTALIVPDWQEALRELSALNVESREPDRLVSEPKLIALIQARIDRINDQLADWEKVRKFKLIRHEFSQERDEVSPSLKLRRHVIVEHYQRDIDSFYDNA